MRIQTAELADSTTDEPQDVLDGRRGEARFTFNALERVAPYAGAELPPLEEFVKVRCYDLSRNGFSFLRAHPPSFAALIAEFTFPTERVYLKARIAHITGATVDGKFQYQVGCEFTGRVQYPEVAAKKPAKTKSD